MSRVWAKFAGLFRSRTFVGMDKTGNRYFAKTEPHDGIMKEKRWVIFKGEHDPTSIPVEWICWLNGQRKRAPTPEEMAQLEARRERVKLNVALLKKEEEERKAKEGKGVSIGKAATPDLKSFIKQFPADSEDNKIEEASDSKDVTSDKGSKESQEQKNVPEYIKKQPESSEPTGSGESFRPGTWQPPT
ncbi:hypothetical protein BUALT_Bualt18G0067800 [Buddleja alternifolia]|uniref:NADH dehydrogenase [ubiquinone] 1 alpha subcomplex subunit 12 n=1 Tax=Buddleja alternifolia TaxID=168488 RepID=A0AAV6W4U7_9LAMI|nr:hypothetical protein BUALT_Bualt18G0067800 [Buddleja alternifolia]